MYICKMEQIEFIRDFAGLGNRLQAYLSGALDVPDLDQAIAHSLGANPWYTSYCIKERLSSIVQGYLLAPKLQSWLTNYPDVWYAYQKDITVVMAGNIPLVGFHDYLSVLASGRTVSVKLSSKDAFLLPALHRLLCSFAPAWSYRLRYVLEVPVDTHGLIATGSDATAAWFTARYPHLPQIVRRHRVSVAVLSADIRQEQISGLQRDMFAYFGLGCRSVVRLFVPKEFDLMRLTVFEQCPDEASHLGFRNAYRRQKALLTLQGASFTDGGFFLLQPKEDLFPPVATVFYSVYTCINEVIDFLEANDSRLQSVVGMVGGFKNCINFGCSQSPQLWDYADGIDTMRL
ncbi:MAG: acyl-CoA reductase [Bacteroidales bacterium]|nr:acyl-CoA reductase [Bacteroidales bacterium]